MQNGNICSVLTVENLREHKEDIHQVLKVAYLFYARSFSCLMLQMKSVKGLHPPERNID